MATATSTPSAATLSNAPSSVRDAAERLLNASSAPGKTAFVARALGALATMTDELDERTLANVAGATSDYRVLLAALQQPEVAAIFREDDPLLPARLRGLEARQQILEAEGGTMTVSEVASMLGITRQAVEKRRKAGKLIALSLGKRGYAYPRWQFSESGDLLPGLDDVFVDLEEHSPMARTIFMLGTTVRLGGERPLDVIRQGRIEDARRAARAYLEHGAA